MSLVKILKSWGLNEKQAQIYLACLEMGSASVYKISQKTGLPRSTCYEVLDSLKPLGLVSTFAKKKVKYFSVEDPKGLINSTKEKLEDLEASLPQLRALYAQSQNQPAIRFYQGKEQMKVILKEMLSEATQLIAFGSADDILTSLGKYYSEYIEQRIKNKIPVKVIVPDSKQARERRRLAPSQLRETRLVDPKYVHHGIVFIWNNKIAMFSLKNELVALVIESQELAETQKAMFNFMWETGEFVE
jgi:sugar-specific transcriptional regulator TrmB